MKVSDIKYNDLTKEVIHKILYKDINDTGEHASCIMVLGSNKSPIYRVPVAVNLFKQNRANKILLCGGRVCSNETNEATEAYHMYSKCVELGIPKENIILEEQSLTTKENFLCALLYLDREFKLCNIQNIILVTTTFHMRRSSMFANTYFPDWINVIPCCADDTNTKASNWWKTDKGYQRAKNEAWKIISYVLEGSINNFTI